MYNEVINEICYRIFSIFTIYLCIDIFDISHYYIYDATSNEIFMSIYNIGIFHCKPKIGCFVTFIFPCYRQFCNLFCPTVP